ncbi:hypothetical protein BDV18DRAFT_136240 [Aspergillus unguis]
MTPVWPLHFNRCSLFSQEIDFIVPDSRFETAVRVLIDTGFVYCDNANCSELKHDRHPHRMLPHVAYPATELAAMLARNTWHEIADAHFHSETKYPGFTVFSLFKQSRLLWWLPTLTLSPVESNDPTFMLTNDAARLPPWIAGDPNSSSGPWLDVSPVKTLTHSALVEALLRLESRYLRVPGYRFDMWNEMFLCALPRAADTERLQRLRESLKPEFQASVDLVTAGCAVNGDSDAKTVANKLHDYLVAKGEL